MGFLDSLRQNNAPAAPSAPMTPSLGISPSSYISETANAIEPFLNRQRNQKMQDAKDMMLWQNIHGGGNGMPGPENARIRQVADPSQPQNVVYQPGISDYQRATLAQNQQGIDLDKMKFGEAKRTGDEKLGIMGERLKLDTEKNNNIYETKQRELEQKASTAEANLQLAKQRLDQNANNAQATAAYHQATIDAQNARHALDLAQRDRTIETQGKESAARIKELEDRIAGRNAPTTETTEVSTDDATGDQKRVTTKTPGARTAAPVSDPSAPKAPAGWMYVKKPGGGWTAVEAK